ncbi:MAG: Arm DNA-binding domain-containing protein [Gammaproteobacteria bacterium]
MFFQRNPAKAPKIQNKYGARKGAKPQDNETRPHALSNLQIKNAKPKEKAYKLADERGLYLLVNPNGSKLWKMKYRFAGREKKLSFSKYPDVSLAQAREMRDDARSKLAQDIDPGVLKNSIKRSKQIAAENSFEMIARE